MFFYNLCLAAFQSGESAIDFVTKILLFAKETNRFLTPQSPATAQMFLAVYSPNIDTMRRFHVLDDMLTYAQLVLHNGLVSDDIKANTKKAHESPAYKKAYSRLNSELVKERDLITLEHGKVDLTKPVAWPQAYLLKPDLLREKVIEWLNLKYVSLIEKEVLKTVVFPDGTERIYRGKTEALKNLIKTDLLTILTHPRFKECQPTFTSNTEIMKTLLEYFRPVLTEEQISSLVSLELEAISKLRVKALFGISLRGDRLISQKIPEGQDPLREVVFHLGRRKGQIIATINIGGRSFQVVIDKNYQLTSSDSQNPLNLSKEALTWWRTSLLTLLAKKLGENPLLSKEPKTATDAGATRLDIGVTEFENLGAPTRFFRRQLPRDHRFTAGQYALAQVFGGINLTEFNQQMQQSGDEHNFTWVLPGIRDIIEKLEESSNLIEIKQLLSLLSRERFDPNSENQQLNVDRLSLLLEENYAAILRPLIREDPIETVFKDAYSGLTAIISHNSA